VSGGTVRVVYEVTSIELRRKRRLSFSSKIK